ncbi:AAA family ATPase [Corynebacterium glutamicum]|uniref:AAA family ATPase n=1 Tax=Corynebacterium glutamicum TaxID=1718 RepID=UPI0014686BE0|nr:AAA family ATPase [Corynebacterium glutamicum]GFK17681.1 adenylate kinase [Corynebacterium glutamicum]
MKTASDPIDWNPQRIAVSGVSGVGKTTLCKQIAALSGFPRVELDSLYHGENWVPRETFVAEVQDFIKGPQWVMELQYRQVRPLIVERADTVLWLDYSTPRQMFRLIKRTIPRSLFKTKLFNDNIEPPLWTIFKDPDHIVRWGWRTRNSLKKVTPTFEGRFAPLTVVRLSSPKETKRWLRVYGESVKL